jgi:hypothetical protein
MVSRTRSGRVVRPPVRYSPNEVCDDDYAPEEYDSDESGDVSSEASYDSEDVSDESDADEDGNLDGFVVKTNSDFEDSDGPLSDSGETDLSDAPVAATTSRGRRTLVL